MRAVNISVNGPRIAIRHLLAGLATLWLAGSAMAAPPDYVGTQTCTHCHQAEAKAWIGSHHDWALKPATAGHVLGDFDNAELTIHGVTSRFVTRDGAYYVETDSADGSVKPFKIAYAVGVEPLQQYLVATEPGKLQTLDLAWDTERKRWFHLYPQDPIKGSDGLHWTGPYKNWNARCADCHQTDYKKAYDPATGRYGSTWSDLNVGCEACHGPGAAHAAWAKDPQNWDRGDYDGVGGKGLTIRFADDQATEIGLCARCHSRRQSLTETMPTPGTPFDDTFRLARLRPGLYHADGQILEEVYVIGSFLQSKMFAKGVRCSHCHDPHTLKPLAEGNALCTQCHNPEGNSDFPSLLLKAYDTSDHHHHEPGSEAAQCVSCHAPATTYMVVDPRRDHSYRVPRPDLSISLGTPNACTGCHADRPAQWAADAVAGWFPQGRTGTSHYGDLIAAARSLRGPDPAVIDRLKAYVAQIDKPSLVRASLLDQMRGLADPALADDLAGLLTDENPMVRASAAALQQAATPAQRVARLLPLLSDPMASVRVEAARQFLALPPASVPRADLDKVRAAQGDYRRSLLATADFPETQLAMAGLALTARRLPLAEQALKTAITMDPGLIDAWPLLARVRQAMRQPQAARQTVTDALAANPKSEPLHLALGQVRLQWGDGKGAQALFEKAIAINPDSSNARVALANLFYQTRDYDALVAILEPVLAAEDTGPDALILAIAGRLGLRQKQAAQDLADKLKAIYPGVRMPQMLRRQLER